MMQQTAYNTITAVLFLVVALLHLLRVIFGWSAQIGGVTVPMWASWLAFGCRRRPHIQNVRSGGAKG